MQRLNLIKAINFQNSRFIKANVLFIRDIFDKLTGCPKLSLKIWIIDLREHI